ncbi:unnamed protein product [Bursaphelenchus xylophilus]|uniref:procollagen-lysine 5-dioxygenase n=1 Tax=Bursaphelenchus xylophilus TaxID=6326 RepID=A0A1I7SX86_BURXY|nr:unnamed protein product [Bursaphelenchus xylophilus]CAG9100250.1 unnamed protein product [Bursaphelenchus xylophilus]
MFETVVYEHMKDKDPSEMNLHAFIAFLAMIFAISLAVNKPKDLKIHLVTVATEETDGLKRLKSSAKHYEYELNVLGMGEKWNGGDMQSAGGGQKIRLLREGVKHLANDESTIILFVDAYDVVINGDIPTLIDRFTWEFPENRILFGAEPFCWPEPELINQYPQVKFGERFLNSGLIMGYAPEFVKMLEILGETRDHDDDQLAYTKLYLDSKTRKELKIGLDSLARIFLNLNGQRANVKMEMGKDGKPEVYNHVYNTHPIFIHGNGPSKVLLNQYANYIGGKQNLLDGCVDCPPLKPIPNPLPTVTLALFIAKPIPYIEEFLEKIGKLDYPKEKIDLFVYNNQNYNYDDVSEFLAKHGDEYKSKEIFNLDDLEERAARNQAIVWGIQKSTDYFLSIDGEAHLTDPEAIQKLIRRSITNDFAITIPMLVQQGRLFSNFWGAIAENGYYSRSEDYVDIVEKKRIGSFNVPFANDVILIKSERLEKLRKSFDFNEKMDPDMSFAGYCRHHGHFLMLDNQETLGFLVFADYFEQLSPETIHKEVYDFPNNKELWEARYLHPDYYKTLEPGAPVSEPCPDVYDFPFISERLSKEMIAIMNHYGKWSSGKNEDERLAGGYENVPTRDIHMRQVGLHHQWLAVLDSYAAPMQEKVFEGYYNRPIQSEMMFVVRYKPDEQSFLRPHNDASTYSIDIALNKRGVDFEGGGVRYVRYNCTVPADEVGHSMLFPGRLTHLHEGLPTTKGTRYILVSFINP